ncbi:hypothetical protein COCVIDRAFT_92103, partial [Bipolaris victoriae FI3]
DWMKFSVRFLVLTFLLLVDIGWRVGYRGVVSYASIEEVRKAQWKFWVLILSPRPPIGAPRTSDFTISLTPTLVNLNHQHHILTIM